MPGLKMNNLDVCKTKQDAGFGEEMKEISFDYFSRTI